MNTEKAEFLRSQFIPLVKKLKGDEKGKWGKMDAQQMVEHVDDFFKVSINQLSFPLTTPADLLPRYKEFLMSEKEFRENTKAPVLPDEPITHKHLSFHLAVDALESDVQKFFTFFTDDQAKTTLHPAFGELNFEEWVQLHHKHVKHHLKQFGLID